MGAIAMEVTLRRSGGSVSATIPSEMARRFHLAPGDRIEAIETEQGILLSPFNPTLQEALALASEAARSYQPALRQLAQ
ncbi:AbrB/MazE/SpoVT family DNA-binding domain-containing protein [Synechococcus sp. UW140]|uniref:AbrB/MazE/SpoVT family DNA-binding domain-containing protein n=1 Tax=Synechococcus sp. UW140 TaxID=368503 RepID=UPI003137B022